LKQKHGNDWHLFIWFILHMKSNTEFCLA
jgi:hypothetical protein